MRLLENARDRGACAVLELLEEMQERLVDLLAHERLKDRRRRFVRGGHYSRTLTTKLGRVRLRIQRVFDRLEGRSFAPLLTALRLERIRYTPDLRLACAEEATRTSYGDAEQAIHRAVGVRVPKRTIWNFVQELAARVDLLHRQRPYRGDREVHQIDSTFVRSQTRGGQHEVHLAVLQRPEDRGMEFVELRVNGPPLAVLEGLRVERLVSDDASAYRGSEPIAQWAHQVCVLHFRRNVGGLTAEGGRWSRESREEWTRAIGALLGRLSASARLHRVDGDAVALTYRVEETLRGLGRVAEDLERAGAFPAARFVRREARATVVFAELAARGVWMPSTSNGVERMMGMIADRCKRKWAHWGSGLRNLLVLLLVRKTRPTAYEAAVRSYLTEGRLA